jgi:tripartite-type tricarboxylate transporter receptor subunit TctC
VEPVIRLLIVAAAFVLASASAASAQTDVAIYPNRVVKIIHQYTAGGGNDYIARVIANGLAQRWGRSVIVEPRPGGGGIIGADAVAKAPPDGYTLLLSANPLSILPAMGKPLPFDVPASFAPIEVVATGPFVMVASNSAPFKTITELIAYAKARPGQVPYASVGVGSPHHMLMELFKSKVGIDLVHVPYKGAAAQMQDIVGGQIPVGFSSLSSALAQVHAGEVRSLAITGDVRSPLVPQAPTAAEAGVPDFEANSWYGLLAPAGTSAAIIERVRADVAAVFSDPALQEKLVAQGFVPITDSTPASFKAKIEREIPMWRDLVARQGLKFE